MRNNVEKMINAMEFIKDKINNIDSEALNTKQQVVQKKEDIKTGKATINQDMDSYDGHRLVA